MSCMTAGGSGKRQHLAVAHEKGKVTILQLTALLKQTDSTQKKLSLTRHALKTLLLTHLEILTCSLRILNNPPLCIRLSSQPVPFTVLSIVANPCNEDFLAVTGLKECHVLAFNNNGTLADHLVKLQSFYFQTLLVFSNFGNLYSRFILNLTPTTTF